MAIKDIPPPIKTSDGSALNWSQLLDWLKLLWTFVRTPALVITNGNAPTAPTGAPGDTSTQIATDAFVTAAIAAQNAAANNIGDMYGMAGVEGTLLTIPTPAIPTPAIPNLSGSRNLRGTVNASTPLTKYDLTSADYVLLTKSANSSVVISAVTSITNDLGLAGSTPNGRDQAAVFPVSSWIYIYYIWNGSTLATVSSLTAPPAGPNLPAAYTHWGLATAIRWGASSNIVPIFTQGSLCLYDIAYNSLNRVLTAGTATTMTALSFAGFAPPITATVIINIIQGNTGSFEVHIRPTGASSAGQLAAFNDGDLNIFNMCLGTSSQLDYSVSAGGNVYIECWGYTISNGAC